MGPSDSANVSEPTRDPGTIERKGKQKSEKSNRQKAAKPAQLEKKRGTPEKREEQESPRKLRKRAAASKSLKEKPIRLSNKDDLIERKKEKYAEEELVALSLTSGRDGDRPNRRLNDFVVHNSEGVPQPLEMLEIEDMFISGLVMPLEATSDKEKERGVRCEGFGRIEGWDISGYEEGSPVIWLTTELADYDCIKPASTYKKYYEHFFEKARVCIEVYNKVTKSSGGDPDCSLDELLAGVVRSMSGSKSFSGLASIKDFVISQGEFIYNQLVGLDDTSKDDKKFADLSVLLALKEESKKCIEFPKTNTISSTSLSIGSGNLGDTETNTTNVEDEDARVARLLQETEYFKTSKLRKNMESASASNKFYIKIDEDEIASDYPLPAFYKTSTPETDEFIIFDNDIDICHPDDLPHSMLHNWALYNTDSRLLSLELLPMKACADIDVVIFGSGVMTADDGGGFILDSDRNQSTSSGARRADGMPIYLSAIKEWTIELGPSMIFVSIRTDMAWYRLGKPSKQYAPWYEPVLKTARVAVSIITLLKEQRRVARLSFADVIKKVSEFEKENPAYISSKPDAVERYVVVHGQIILQLFAEYPDNEIKRCAFLTGLNKKMEQKHHTKWLVKKKKSLEKGGRNLNPRASSQPLTSKRKAMQATTTRLINRIWGEYYSNYSPEDSKEETPKEEEEEEEENEDQDEMLEEDDAEEEISLVTEDDIKVSPTLIPIGPCSNETEIRWDGDPVGGRESGNVHYKQAFVCGNVIAVGKSVFMEAGGSDKLPPIYYVEYMFETPKGEKMFHGRLLQYGSLTVLGSTADQREVFLTNECTTSNLDKIKQTVAVDFRKTRWEHQHRKDNWNAFKLDRARAEERMKKGLPIEYYCRTLYWPEKGAFFCIPYDSLGLGTGVCNSCNIKQVETQKGAFRINSSRKGFFNRGAEFSLNDFIYASPSCFAEEDVDIGTFKGGRNIGLRAYVVCQLLEIIVPEVKREATAEDTQVKVRRFFRPEDISPEKAYHSDIREIYYSEDMHYLSVEAIEGTCMVRKKHEVTSYDSPAILHHVFFCERLYDPSKGSLKQLPAQIKIKYSNANASSNSPTGEKRGKSAVNCTENQGDGENRLATLDIFAGCGGLSEGLDKSGVSTTKWAIEYEEPAGEAFRLNHPESYVFIENCNVLLRAIMEKCEGLDECISTTEAAELAAKLDEQTIKNLPLPGQVDFINGGPPCQGFSGMNRFNQSTWSKVQCEMILAFLSFADYYRPKYFLLENVRNFVSFNKGQTFRLTLASLLEMGYQVRFGILEAGAFGVSQSRKRAFIWAASPEETLPEWPQPMHVFGVPDLKIKLSDNLGYVAAPSTAAGAPFRAITVRDTIGDLPVVRNGASEVKLAYQSDPISWFQKKIRGNMAVLTDHISKEMNELNMIRCQRIPKRPGADWRDLPNIKVTLSSGEVADLIPWCLPNTADRHNQWKGLFGRLDWEGNFPTSITDPQPMGKVGMCFHPDQDRIVTVRECARSQGFPDSYKFAGNIQHRHRQIGNAVPPPLAFALGLKLKEAWESKRS